MTSAAKVATLTPVSTSGNAHFDLELDTAPGRIRGTIRDARGALRTFEGWTQLTSLLEAARAGSRESSPSVTEDTNEGAPR